MLNTFGAISNSPLANVEILSGEDNRQTELSISSEGVLQILPQEFSTFIDHERERLSLIGRQVLIRILCRQEFVDQQSAEDHLLFV
jgi:hypothetical protein